MARKQIDIFSLIAAFDKLACIFFFGSMSESINTFFLPYLTNNVGIITFLKTDPGTKSNSAPYVFLSQKLKLVHDSSELL